MLFSGLQIIWLIKALQKYHPSKRHELLLHIPPQMQQRPFTSAVLESNEFLGYRLLHAEHWCWQQIAAYNLAQQALVAIKKHYHQLDVHSTSQYSKVWRWGRHQPQPAISSLSHCLGTGNWNLHRLMIFCACLKRTQVTQIIYLLKRSGTFAIRDCFISMKQSVLWLSLIMVLPSYWFKLESYLS